MENENKESQNIQADDEPKEVKLSNEQVNINSVEDKERIDYDHEENVEEMMDIDKEQQETEELDQSNKENEDIQSSESK